MAYGTHTETALKGATEAAVVAALTTAANGWQQIGDGIPFLVGPDGKVTSLEAFLGRPLVKKGSPKFDELQSFCDYANQHADPQTRLFADLSDQSFSIVFDHHGKGAEGLPGRMQHRAYFSPEIHPDWQAWTKADRRSMGQVDFAEFIEDNLRNIVDPVAADMLELAQTLEVKKSVEFTSSRRLADGQTEFTFNETLQANGRGTLEVPNKITLSLPVFKGGGTVTITARFRFRLHDQKLAFAYLLDHPEELREAAFRAMLAEINKGTGLPALMGRP
jgi:uncharacterized protein YfdQ (DUF2303 family)